MNVMSKEINETNEKINNVVKTMKKLRWVSSNTNLVGNGKRISFDDFGGYTKALEEELIKLIKKPT